MPCGQFRQKSKRYIPGFGGLIRASFEASWDWFLPRLSRICMCLPSWTSTGFTLLSDSLNLHALRPAGSEIIDRIQRITPKTYKITNQIPTKPTTFPMKSPEFSARPWSSVSITQKSRPIPRGIPLLNPFSQPTYLEQLEVGIVHIIYLL